MVISTNQPLAERGEISILIKKEISRLRPDRSVGTSLEMT
jgi:hypothetical protein